MDPIKQLGKVREQVDREHVTRRRYELKHSAISNKNANDKLYNQNLINEKLSKKLALRPYQYTGEGESYFVSNQMYNSLLSTCRCGRPRTDGHAIKCLQKEKDKYLDPVTKSSVIRSFGNHASKINQNSFDSLKLYKKNENILQNNDAKIHDASQTTKFKEEYFKSNGNYSVEKSFCTDKLPETSNGMIGWMKKPYWKWEKSTYYISPKYTMAGYKIDDHPYSNIFIG